MVIKAAHNSYSIRHLPCSPWDGSIRKEASRKEELFSTALSSPFGFSEFKHSTSSKSVQTVKAHFWDNSFSQHSGNCWIFPANHSCPRLTSQDFSSTHIPSRFFCPDSIKCRVIPHRAGFQTGFGLPGSDFIDTQKFSTFHPPATSITAGQPWDLSPHFITPLYHPCPVMNCSSLLGLLEPRLGQKTLKAWSKQIASMLSDGSVPVLITSLPISLSEAPSQCAHLSSPLLCLQVLHLSFLPCWNIWAAPFLLTVHFIETTRALRNRL